MFLLRKVVAVMLVSSVSDDIEQLFNGFADIDRYIRLTSK